MYKTISQVGLNLIRQLEGCKLKPYLCPAGIPTIGVGCTYYEDGTRVTMNDRAISSERANELLKNTLKSYEEAVNYYTKQPLNQFQFDALCSFCFNVGSGNFKMSTMLKKINLNPNDPSIQKEFMKWNRGAGKVLDGLSKRRKIEADVYFGII